MDGLMDGVIRSELGLPRHRPSARRAAIELARREALLAELNAIDGLTCVMPKGAFYVSSALARP